MFYEIDYFDFASVRTQFASDLNGAAKIVAGLKGNPAVHGVKVTPCDDFCKFFAEEILQEAMEAQEEYMKVNEIPAFEPHEAIWDAIYRAAVRMKDQRGTIGHSITNTGFIVWAVNRQFGEYFTEEEGLLRSVCAIARGNVARGEGDDHPSPVMGGSGGSGGGFWSSMPFAGR